MQHFNKNYWQTRVLCFDKLPLKLDRKVSIAKAKTSSKSAIHPQNAKLASKLLCYYYNIYF